MGYQGSYGRGAAFARAWKDDRQREQQTRFSDAGPSSTIAVRRDRAGVRKPPRKETDRKGVAAAATYGDLSVARFSCRAVGMTIKNDFEG